MLSVFKGLSRCCCIHRTVLPSCGINRNRSGDALDRVSLSCDVTSITNTQVLTGENMDGTKGSIEMKMHFDVCQFRNSSAAAKEAQTLSN